MTLSYDDLARSIHRILNEAPTNKGIGGRFTTVADERPDQLAVIDGADRRTFAELERDANRAAHVLSSRGVEPGRAVALVLPNSTDFVVLALATWKLGGTVSPISHRMPLVERQGLLDLAEPAVTVTIDDLAGLLAEAAGAPDTAWPDIASPAWKAMGSGGSTGRPKLVKEHSAGPIRPGVAGMFGMRPGGVHLVAGPMYHSAPFAWATSQLLAGGTLVFGGKFDPAVWLRTVEEQRVSWAFVVPTMLHRIMGLPEAVRRSADLSSLEVVMHTAAPCPPWLKERAIDLLGAEVLWEYYGATEVAGTMIRGDDWLSHRGSVGRPLPGLGLTIRDEAGTPLPAGEVGEIWLAPPGGPTFSYVGADARASEGAVSVGDLGWLDDDGYLFISDRRTDLIISGGANIYPAEVEGVLLAHPLVGDAAVVGLPHDDWGQRVHAIIAPRAGKSAPDPDEVDAFLRTRLADYKLPKAIEVVEALPRDPSGKLRRSALRAARV